MGEPVVVSVVRDREMYSRCVSGNTFLSGCRLVIYDNVESNLPVSVRYNSFLDTLRPGSGNWIIFCHEDWRIDENLKDILTTLDPSYIYGVVGAFLQRRCRCDYVIYKGSVRHSMKDGSEPETISFPIKSGRVDTLDCQCMIIHSDLVLSRRLRFDENLLFDMYVEDFCVSAFLDNGIISKVVPIKSTHFSKGNISEGFLSSLEYVRLKYSGSSKRFATIVGYKTAFGGDSSRPLHKALFPTLASLLG